MSLPWARLGVERRDSTMEVNEEDERWSNVIPLSGRVMHTCILPAGINRIEFLPARCSIWIRPVGSSASPSVWLLIASRLQGWEIVERPSNLRLLIGIA